MIEYHVGRHRRVTCVSCAATVPINSDDSLIRLLRGRRAPWSAAGSPTTQAYCSTRRKLNTEPIRRVRQRFAGLLLCYQTRFPLIPSQDFSIFSIFFQLRVKTHRSDDWVNHRKPARGIYQTTNVWMLLRLCRRCTTSLGQTGRIVQRKKSIVKISRTGAHCDSVTRQLFPRWPSRRSSNGRSGFAGSECARLP